MRKSSELDSFVESFKNMLRNIFLVLGLTYMLYGCGNSIPNTYSTDTYIIATLKGPSSMGMIKLIDSLRQGNGNSVQVKILNEPLQVRKMMIEGTADFAVLPTTMAAIIYNKGLEYQLIAIPVWGALYLAGGDTTITCWEDLRGKRVNVMARGMTPDVLFRYLLEKNDIIPDKDITLDYSFPTHIDLANAIAAGQTDLGVISEPLASMVIQRNKSVRRIFDLNDEWSKYQSISVAGTAFMGKKSVIQSNPNITEKLISSYRSSTNWVNQNPDSAAILIVKHEILPNRDVALNAIPRSNLNFIRAGEIRIQIEEYLNLFYLMNPDIIGGKIPDEDFIY